MNPKADNRNTIASFPLRGAAVVLAAALVGLAGPAAWGQALISAAVTAGDPCDGAFSVSVSISGNTAGPVGTYAFTVTWPAAFTYTNATDGAFGVAPTVGTAGSPNSRNISAFNAGSTLQNGVLFVVNLTNPGDVEGTITMADYGPTPLIGIDFMDIPHTFEPLPIFCGVAQPTDTPTQPGPAPTDTPTSPVVVPTDTSSAPPTDTPAVTVPTDTPITGAVISAHIPGDPCGGQFAVEVAISGNAQQAVGTYAFVLTWPVGLTYVSKADGAFGVAPDVAAGPTENSRVFSAFNAGSTLVNGVLFVVTLDNPESLEGPVTVADFGPTPLIDVGFAEIPHGFQPANVTCGIVQPTETPTGPVVLPTDTPTGPVIGPTDTPTGPIVVPTDTPTGPVVEPTGTPTEPVAVPTDTATSPPPPTDTPIEGVVIFPRIVGAPCGGEFAVEVVVAGHEPPAVGTYAFTFHWPEGVSFVGVADGEFGVRPDVAAGTTENSRKISAFNAGSTFVNGVLFVVTLDNSGSIEGPLTVMDFGPTPLIDIAFQPIEHVFLPAAVSCAPPTPTDTPTSPAPPTDTPTQAPPTETPTLPTTDFDEDGILDVFESRRPTTQANWLLPDSDADGLDDGVEDANRDGVRDSNETDPRSADTDGDGWQDGVEVKLLATDPLDDADPEPGMLIDEDGDGLPSSIDPDDSRVDTDGDRYSDTYEAVVLDLAAAANPNVRPTLGDINGDGLVDRADGDLANRIWLGTTPLVLEQTRNADVNGNGWVDALDAMLIHGVELGRTDLLPAR